MPDHDYCGWALCQPLLASTARTAHTLHSARTHESVTHPHNTSGMIPSANGMLTICSIYDDFEHDIATAQSAVFAVVSLDREEEQEAIRGRPIGLTNVRRRPFYWYQDYLAPNPVNPAHRF